MIFLILCNFTRVAKVVMQPNIEDGFVFVDV